MSELRPVTIYLSDAVVGKLEVEAQQAGRSGVSSQVRWMLEQRVRDEMDSISTIRLTYDELHAVFEEYWQDWDRPFRRTNGDRVEVTRTDPGVNRVYDARLSALRKLQQAKSFAQSMLVR